MAQHVRGRWAFALSLLGWVAVWGFWLTATRHFHPTFALAVIVTTALVAAYAAAAYLNHLVLLPRFWSAGTRLWYFAALAVLMVAFTATALAVIRLSYRQLLGPDPDPNGAYKHFAIDLFGMAVHLLVAAGVVAIARRLMIGSPGSTPQPVRLPTDN
jgi:hypothetical protein